MRYIYIIHQAKVSGFAIIDHRSSLTRSRGPVFVHLILAVNYPVRDLLAWENDIKYDIDIHLSKYIDIH